MQRHYVMVRWNHCKAVNLIKCRILPLASGEQSQVVQSLCLADAMLAFVPAWWCWLTSVFSLDKKGQGGGVWWGSWNSSRGQMCNYWLLGVTSPLYGSGVPFIAPTTPHDTPNMTHWGLMTSLLALCVNQRVSCIFFILALPRWHLWQTQGFWDTGEGCSISWKIIDKWGNVLYC